MCSCNYLPKIEYHAIHVPSGSTTWIAGHSEANSTSATADNTTMKDSNDSVELSDTTSEPLAEIIPNIVRDLIAEVPSGNSFFSGYFEVSN